MLLGGCGYSTPSPNVPSTRINVWGSMYSPFRNTNVPPLQDVTMSQTLPLTNSGGRRAYGEGSPREDETTMARSGGDGGSSGTGGVVGYGRSMKEYEDQLSSLKKENFNLKLRIFFLEERMGVSSADKAEFAVKTNVELQIELENLRKELEEKQELLNQAARAIKLFEEQKEATSRTQEQYQQTLEKEREKVIRLEKEVTEYRDRELDASTYYKEAFGITPEQALKNAEKLRQMEELVASLETEVKQITSSLDEERSWAQELENERDQFRERLDVEMRLREKLDVDRVRSIEELRESVKALEEQVFKKDSIAQQYKNDLAERDRLLKQKSTLLEEKCRAYEDITQAFEKKKKQIVQLRASVKTRDDAFAELNNKHRALLSQCENMRSPPSSPLTLNSLMSRLSPPMGQRVSCMQNAAARNNDGYVRESSMEKENSPLGGDGKREVRQLIKELEERDGELKHLQEARKQMTLKLCNAQKQTEDAEQKLKKMEGEHEKAIRAIQGFMERDQQIRDADFCKDQKILELETELRKRKNGHGSPISLRDLGVKNADERENESRKQQRFEEMESKINDLRDQIETIKAEKSLLEKRIQVESEELQGRLHDKEQRIEFLETEKQTITKELMNKIVELDKLKHAEACSDAITADRNDTPRREELFEQLNEKNTEIEEKNQKIEQLTKELQMRTQNLQKLVNTELWSKNKEIAKLRNHMTASHGHDRIRSKSENETDNVQLTNLIRELNEIGVRVTFANEAVQLDYTNGDKTVDVRTLAERVQRLSIQRDDLEKEVDYLKWLKLVSRPDIAAEIDGCGNETERAKKYCELLRTHLKDLVRFMKEMLKNGDRADTIGNEHKKIVLDVLLSSKILSDDFVRALEGMSMQSDVIVNDRTAIDGSVRKSRSENAADAVRNQASQSDSEAFSEPDRTVSMARIGLQETQHRNLARSRFTKFAAKVCSDSEDSAEYVPYYKTYQNDLNDLDASHQIQELKETNNMLYSELSALRNDLMTRVSFDCAIDEKLTPFIAKLEKSERFCEKLQVSLEKRIHEFHTLRKESKQNSIRKMQLEKKMNDVEQIASEMTKQRAEFLQYKENTDRKATETLLILNKENESLRARIQQLDEESETAKATISTLRKELDHLTLSHSQILVENTKLMNDKLRLEQEVRKAENRYDATVRSLHDKFSKEISDLNQINDSHRARVQELEVANKEFRRHMAVCEASDSAPSSSGVSSIPTDATLKQACDDILQEYQPYNNLQYWQPTNYSTIGGRSKSSCSPDLGIESDAAVTTMRPLKDTLKITESMTNLLSDDENPRDRDTNSESPLPVEGLDEVEALKQENEALKRKLMKTRKALEETFEHLSASNKNKKNVEKAIIKQLMATRSILKKTRTFDEPLEN